MTFPSFRSIFCLIAFALVSYVFIRNTDDKLVIGASIAWGGLLLAHYYSSTKAGSDTATKNAEVVAAVASNAATPTTVQPVEVVNDADKPVPTVDA